MWEMDWSACWRTWICFDEEPLGHVLNMVQSFKHLRQHNLKLSPGKARVGATHDNFIDQTISPAGVNPDREVRAFMHSHRRQMPSNFGVFSVSPATTGNS